MDNPRPTPDSSRIRKREFKGKKCPVRDAGERDPTKIPLSPREMQVLQLVMQGRMNKEIARDLGITRATVEFHLSNIFAKLAVRSRLQAALRARFGI